MEIKYFTVRLELHEDLDGVDLEDRIAEGICDQMHDVNYTLAYVKEEKADE